MISRMEIPKILTHRKGNRELLFNRMKFQLCSCIKARDLLLDRGLIVTTLLFIHLRL